MEKLKAGGETSAYCTSCKDMRHHVVVAMSGDVPAKVECLSCHKQHKFKAGPPGTKAAKVAKISSGGSATKTKSARPAAGSVPAFTGPNPLEAILASRGTGGARSYSPAERYAIGELVSHPSFGIGAVTATPSPGKMSVLFRDTTRLLLHERAPAVVAPVAKLAPPPRREDIPTGPADRPPKVKPIL